MNIKSLIIGLLNLPMDNSIDTIPVKVKVEGKLLDVDISWTGTELIVIPKKEA